MDTPIAMDTPILLGGRLYAGSFPEDPGHQPVVRIDHERRVMLIACTCGALQDTPGRPDPIRAFRQKEGDAPMTAWTHALCRSCWDKRNPAGRTPVQSRAPEAPATCCDCGAATSDGIYLRVDPATMTCLGNHAEP